MPSLKTIAGRAPELVVLCIITFAFLRHADGQREDFRKALDSIERRHTAAIKELSAAIGVRK